MINFVLFALVLAALSQSGREWGRAAFLFVAVTLGFDVIGSEIPGGMYYLAAAATDALCATMLRNFRGSFPLVVLCFISCNLNFFGWCLYELYVSPEVYNSAFILFYTAAVLVIVGGGPNNARFANRRNFPRVQRGNP